MVISNNMVNSISSSLCVCLCVWVCECMCMCMFMWGKGSGWFGFGRSSIKLSGSRGCSIFLPISVFPLGERWGVGRSPTKQ